MMMTMIVFNKQ